MMDTTNWHKMRGRHLLCRQQHFTHFCFVFSIDNALMFESSDYLSAASVVQVLRWWLP